jgi:hypothetical protein
MKIPTLLILGSLFLAIYGCEKPQATTPVANSDTPNSAPNPGVESPQTPLPQSGSPTQFGKDTCIPIEEPRDGNVFDPSQLKAGDRFLDLKVITISASCRTSGSIGTYDGTTSFQGEITVSGVYNPKKPLPGSEDVCFDVVAQDDPKLPRMWGDRRRPSWFCFDNPEQAKRRLGSSKALLAKIVINNYTIRNEPKDTYNLATLVRVIDTIPIN